MSDAKAGVMATVVTLHDLADQWRKAADGVEANPGWSKATKRLATSMIRLCADELDRELAAITALAEAHL